jgi:hypothetical protein
MSRRPERPDPEWVRAVCPDCSGAVIANYYHVGGRGYVLLWECWEALGEEPVCHYRRPL